MSVFTSRNSPFGQSTSQLFTERGNPNQIPCPVFDCDVFSITSSRSTSECIFASNIGEASLSALLDGKSIPTGGSVDAVSQLPGTFMDVLTPPLVVVSFKGKELQDHVQTLTERFGMVREASSGRQFYKGALTIPQLEQLALAGGEMDTQSPYGTTNGNGLLTFDIMGQLITGAYQAFPKPFGSNHGYGVVCPKWDEEMAIKIAPSGYRVTESKRVPGEGVVLPFFDGLNIPDKNGAMSCFLRHFSRVLGANDKQASEIISLVRSGWRSLATTPVGITISHLLFGLDLALGCGARPYVYTFNTCVYGGVVLAGGEGSVVKGGKVIDPVDKAGIINILVNINSHLKSLQEICEVLSVLPAQGESAPEQIEAADISGPRTLRELILERTIDAKQMARIKRSVQGVHFEQNFYSCTDVNRIIEVIGAIHAKKELNRAAPLAYKTDALFTKNTTLASLSAFGHQAPTFKGRGNSVSSPIRAQKTFERKTKEKPLPGVPIFVKPLQQAFEDWEGIIRDSMVTFGILGGQGTRPIRIPTAKKVIPFESEEVERLERALGVFSQQTKTKEAKKRRADQIEKSAEKGDPAEAEARRKVRKTIAGVFSRFQRASDAKQMDED